MKERGDRVRRFQDSERFLHWGLAIPFLVCATSAIVLVLVYNPSPERPLRALVSWLHRLSGACFLIVPLWVAIRHRANLALYWSNIREGWRFGREDLRWLILQGPASARSKAELPEASKFNAGQKLNLMMVTATWPLFALTGAMIWFSDVPFVSWLLHFLIATVALPLVAGHIYMALLNPATRKGLSGMLTGFVDRHWVAHHHPRWYRETYGDLPAPPPPPVPLPRPAPAVAADPMERPARILCVTCGSEHVVASWEILLRDFFTAGPTQCPGCGVALHTINPLLGDPEILEPLLSRLEQRSATAAHGTALGRIANPPAHELW